MESEDKHVCKVQNCTRTLKKGPPASVLGYQPLQSKGVRARDKGVSGQALVRRAPRVPHPNLVHYMYAGPFGRELDIMSGAGLRARGPRLLSLSPRPGWQRCELIILSVKVRSPSRTHPPSRVRQPQAKAKIAEK